MKIIMISGIHCPTLAYWAYNKIFGGKTVSMVLKPCTHHKRRGICERSTGKEIRSKFFSANRMH